MSTVFTVKSVNQPLPAQVSQVALIQQTVLAAGLWLNSYVKGLGSIDVEIRFDGTIATVNAASSANQSLGNVTAANGNTYQLLRDSVPTEWQTGIDVNGSAGDATINIGTTNLDKFYWFDPTLSTVNDIPANKTDAFRVILHELLHCMGFNGWVANSQPGATNIVCSPYDQYFVVSGGRSYFTGPAAVQAFGGPVPVTGSHLGDTLSFSQGVLTGASTLMSYDFVPNGSRISLDPVVIGVLRDLGYTVRDTQAGFSGQAGALNTAQIGVPSDGFALVHTLDLTWLTFKGKSDYAYLLQNEQRLKFSDQSVALDMGLAQAGGETALLIGAVLGKGALTAKKPLLGSVIDLFDQGYTLQQLCGAVMRLPIWDVLTSKSAPTSTDIASYLLTTVNGSTPDTATLAAGADSISRDPQGDFLWHLATSAANQVQIGLVGLAASGMEFVS